MASSPVVGLIYDHLPSPAWVKVAHELVAGIDVMAERCSGSGSHGGASEELLRSCWSLALLVELVRGVEFKRSALFGIGEKPILADLLGVMPAPAVADLQSLERAFREHLVPLVLARDGELAAGPAFSSLLPGDADLIKGRTLIEIKAMVHRRNRDGTPRYSVDARMLYQVLAYALLSQERFSVDEVVIFNARYAHVYSWRLSSLLAELAGSSVETHELAAELKMFLKNPVDQCVPLGARRAALAVFERAGIPQVLSTR
ncbi:hypothetical protein KUF57_26250 [Mycolicibacterium sp. PAM1]|uniref:hypothetical protein n=1 Tax=Mycolicibacterium sp. PAM1 TaxID=2853535 RepID=UPI001C3D5194|nr:hypothetical protein [Mycolicibacterium sp. PAM1]MBV5247032.1 hypothetical protein [Mycolicibacterium sp. PAM1]